MGKDYNSVEANLDPIHPSPKGKGFLGFSDKQRRNR